MLAARFICLPISVILTQIEKFVHSISDPKIEVEDEKNELADHIRTLSRESSTLDPEVFEIVGNTLEMGHLHVRDVLVPRNQVQVLNYEDPIEECLQNSKIFWPYKITHLQRKSRPLHRNYSCKICIPSNVRRQKR